MKKYLAVIGTTMALFAAVPAVAVRAGTETEVYPNGNQEYVCEDYSDDVGYYRDLSRQVLHDDGAVYDAYEMGVVMNSYGDCVAFPETVESAPHYFRFHGDVQRGEVVMIAELYDEFGEVDDVQYYILDNGNYPLTWQLEDDHWHYYGELPMYAYLREA